jgi:AcrR family transcriptional regulator
VINYSSGCESGSPRRLPERAMHQTESSFWFAESRYLRSMPKVATSTGTSRREQRRRAQQDVSRAQLLDAAEDVFGRKGFHATTLKEVAELAEFSVGSVYSFFDSKDDLFRQIFERRGDEFMPGLRALLKDAKRDPVEQLHAVVDFEIGFFREHPRFGRLYLRYSSATALSPDRELDMVMQERYEEAMHLQASLFRRGQRAGVLRKGDPEVLARLFSGLMSAYQALDPAVISDDPGVGERLPLIELHEIVESAFTVR